MKNEYWKYWNLQTDAKGRQRWFFNSPEHKPDWNTPKGKAFLSEMQQSFEYDNTTNPNSSDLVYRAQQEAKSSLRKFESFEIPPSESPSKGRQSDVSEACHKAINYYTSLQSESGHFPGDYGGPHFLTPGLVVASYVTQTPLPEPHQALIRQYILNHQNKDGGWGLHIEDASTMFGTVMNYVALRLLGEAEGKREIAAARNWIKKNGGATGIPSWGKFYLSVLGVYEWSGCNSLFPEMWLLPESLPFHPSRYWCHARMVYLPMAYCYGLKVTGSITPLIKEIRNEIYTTPYESINWAKARNECAVTDLYHQPSALLTALNFITNSYESVRSSFVRNKAAKFLLQYIQAEDEQTNYINIGPVNQVINSICIHHAFGKQSEPFKKHYERWFDYLWLAEDGMKMNGYNGSQLWDTAFAAQAIIEAGKNDESIKHDALINEALASAYQYLDVSQVKEEVVHQKKFYRHASVGGWPFSNVEHGWPITDCTAEGIKTALAAKDYLQSAIKTPIADARLKQAADLLLTMQNEDGGWASYELTRAPKWIEKLNPSEIFGNIMIDYSYTECTSASVQSLIKFTNRFPAYRWQQIAQSIENGIAFILSQQKADGSWYGSWAVCFTYGTWFAVEALTHYKNDFRKEGTKQDVSPALEKAKQFLLSKQNKDGGWGEDFESCRSKAYAATGSKIVNTSWALLSLMAIKESKPETIEKGIQFLLSKQTESGDFPQETISGVFNHSCGISYTSYRNVFPIWALGRYMGKTASPLKVNEVPSYSHA